MCNYVFIDLQFEELKLKIPICFSFQINHNSYQLDIIIARINKLGQSLYRMNFSITLHSVF